MYPENLRYTKEHEWIEVSGAEVKVGVTFFAQKELGDIVFIELPEVGRKLKAGEEFGTIESVKAVTELYSPLSGEVTAVNSDLSDRPEMVNEDPYSKGWILKLSLGDPSEVEALMDAAAYQQLLGK
jgi:glycine cleavage system H protein